MGSATIQGQLWGARGQDWATYVEQVCLLLFGAALDAGCGAGLLALLASLRGAQVSALDASPGLLAIARQRLSAADVREGDLEALPFADAGGLGAALLGALAQMLSFENLIRRFNELANETAGDNFSRRAK